MYFVNVEASDGLFLMSKELKSYKKQKPFMPAT